MTIFKLSNFRRYLFDSLNGTATNITFLFLFIFSRRQSIVNSRHSARMFTFEQQQLDKAYFKTSPSNSFVSNCMLNVHYSMKTCIPFIQVFFHYNIYQVFNIPMLIVMNVFLNKKIKTITFQSPKSNRIKNRLHFDCE